MRGFKYPVIDENCPNVTLENEANGKEGNYYRLAEPGTRLEDNFIPHYYIEKHKSLIDVLKEKNNMIALCKACGLSLFKSKREAFMASQKGKTAGHNIYMGLLTLDLGILKATSSNNFPSHHTWYPFEDIIFSSLFNKIEEIDNGN